MRRAALFLLVMGLVLAASACGERAEPTGPTVKLYPVTVSSNGQTITLERAPSRIALATEPATAVVSALKPRVDVLGGPHFYSGLANWHPDLVIASSGADFQRIARATKAPVYTISDVSVRQVEQSISDLGALLGRPLQARRLVTDIASKRREVLHKVGSLPRVSVFVDTGFYITVPTKSLAGEIVSDAGGEDVAGANPGGGPFDLTLLARKNPDFYVATSDSGGTLKDLRRNPRTKHLRAVRSGHFGIVPSSYLQPGPLIGDGILAVAKLLHPDAFR